MDTTWNAKNAVRAKVAFLAIFVAALISARLIVALRSAVVLSEPIRLAHAGLSVSMPQGNGWNSAKKWECKQDTFILFGAFAPGSSRPTASARCDYVFPNEIIDLEKRFELRQREIGGEIAERGQIKTDFATIDWVRIEQDDASSNCIFGTAELPYNRRINIEVRETTADLDLARGVFKAVAKSLSITDTPLIEAAATVITQMKDKGLAGSLDNKNRQSLFLISDSIRRIIGFTTDILIDTGSTSGLNMEAMGLYYTTGTFLHEEMTSFQSDNRFDRFTWKTESVAAERSSIEIVLKDKGLLTVTKSGEPNGASSYHTGDTAVPEILLEQLLARIIESDIQEAIVDVITSDGQIVPTHISQIKPQDTTADQSDPYMIKLMPLSGRGFFQWVYLDEQRRISRSEQHGLERRIYKFFFDRAEPEDVAKRFPERSEFILQSDKLRQYLDKMI
jgi:hypothetical protein